VPVNDEILYRRVPCEGFIAAELKRQVHEAITFEGIGFDDVGAASIQQ
jgi:hypothetical protein